MNEQYPKRREVASEQIEQSKKYQAIQRLTDLGVFKKVSDLELYHGRAGESEGNWKVDPSFDNSDNNTGNRNINKRPALNTSDYKTARDFSERRAYGIKKAEVHRIVSHDPDAVVIDTWALNDLDRQSQQAAAESISSITLGVLRGAPLKFEDRHALDRFGPKKFTDNQYDLMLESEIDSLKKKTGLSASTIRDVGSAINTKNLLERGYLSTLCRAFLDSNSSPQFNDQNGNPITIPISQEYLANWFRANHIVGCKTMVDSATLGKRIENYVLFDLEKINTPETEERKAKERSRRFGKISLATGEMVSSNQSKLVQMLSSNLYAKPREIVEMAKQTPGFKRIFEADAGNWEGFKVDEHTETVLRLFDDNYADILPASTLPIMRLSLLVHDIGKGESVKNNDRANQELYNIKYAREFMRLNGIDNATSNLVISMIGEGKDLAERSIINRDLRATKKLRDFCEKIAQEYVGPKEADEGAVLGFMSLLEVLQLCDSAAYTTMAITRAKRGVRYRNYGTFNGSFDPFHGFTGRRANWKK